MPTADSRYTPFNPMPSNLLANSCYSIIHAGVDSINYSNQLRANCGHVPIYDKYFIKRVIDIGESWWILIKLKSTANIAHRLLFKSYSHTIRTLTNIGGNVVWVAILNVSHNVYVVSIFSISSRWRLIFMRDFKRRHYWNYTRELDCSWLNVLVVLNVQLSLWKCLLLFELIVLRRIVWVKV